MGEWDAPHLNPCDDKIMPFVDLCNIACGGHAGNKEIIESSIQLATANSVKIGAHPSFEDRLNFGRKYLPLSEVKLHSSINKQIELFLTVCDIQNVIPFHIKAHGALYHACNQNNKEAKILIKVIKQLCPNLILLVAPESLLENLAKAEGLITLAESFIDRKYNDDLSLVSRSEPKAVILNIEEAKKQYEALKNGHVITRSGKSKIICSKTSCIHGDNPNCVQILKSIRDYE
jgi:UPF0271 protein